MTGLPAAARLCLAAGLLGLVLCMINQFSAPELSPALERAAVLASLMAVGLMLVALLWSRANPLAPELVELEGPRGLELIAGLPGDLAVELGWGSRMLLTATPAASLVVLWQGQVILRRGVLAPRPFAPGAICQRARQTGKAVSLVTLKLYPGADEFGGLPAGTPAVLVQPIGEGGWLVLGGWSPRCFSRSDEAWIEGWAEKLRTSLQGWCGPGGSQGPGRTEQSAAGSSPDHPAS
ncbi:MULTISPECIES: cofactor assembly of complex C subunit B [unclassified Synechococcus]|uniref:cofactor assembly of complex C subunit B n=1 Tax=unclassified Synechococcus TaxID=2626047 RepID=UPI0028F3F06C|nr:MULTISPECIES: cofactor assembly of complex C subunit B [unclassified Synechococcus]